MNDYNGWTNRETWHVTLTLSNTLDTHQLARHCKGDAGALAALIKDWVTDDNPLTGNDVYSELLGAAIAKVDWHQIAEHWLLDYEADNPAYVHIWLGHRICQDCYNGMDDDDQNDYESTDADGSELCMFCCENPA